MNYVVYAFVALVAYSVVPPFVDIATEEIPSSTAALISNSILVAVALGVVAYNGDWDVSYLTGRHALYAYAAGVALAVGILAYYRALELGPVSVVVPIFGMFIVGSAVVGVVFLDESVTARKVVGVALAVVAVYLVTVEP
ncbi:MAG: EamA family transporter [Halobacteriales archaeon]|nr:EamA family transporter [Halobacteriales archaeon]